MMEWRDQVAVVTGGARGLGRATARLLAQRGAVACVNYAVHADAAEAVVAEVATAGGRAIAVAADVANSAAVEAIVARAEANPGPSQAVCDDMANYKAVLEGCSSNASSWPRSRHR